MSPRFLFRSSGMALLLGSLFGLSWTIMSALILPLAHLNQFASPVFLVASLLMFFAAVAIVPGLVNEDLFSDLNVEGNHTTHLLLRVFLC